MREQHDTQMLEQVIKANADRLGAPAKELGAASDRLTRQVEAIAPKVIITSGRFASQTVLGLDLSMSRLRGTIRSFHGVPVVPMYHPAYLLRNPSAKRQAYDDLLTVKSILREGGQSAG